MPKKFYDTTQALMVTVCENNAKLKLQMKKNQQTITKMQENNIANKPSKS